MVDSSWGGPGLSRTVRVAVPGGGIQMNVHPEMAVICQTLITRLHNARRRAGRSALTSSGGYNKRLISGSSTWSNHSWGLAMDFNAATNPYQYTLRTDFPIAETRAIAKALGFRWGADYSGKKDPMHFEYLGSRTQARALTTILRGSTVPSPINSPTLLRVDGDLGPATVRELQRDLGVPVDGWFRMTSPLLPNFGPNTNSALQRRVGARVDGALGPITVTYLQRRLGVYADGKWGSGTTAALQRRLNAGSL